MTQDATAWTPPPGSTLVVGAGPGLGASVARRFAKEGRQVALSARHPEHLRELASELSGVGAQVIAVPGDATDPQDVERVVREASQELGPIGTLIYNAGNYVFGRLEDLSPNTFERALAVGVYGAFLYSQAVYPSMKASGRGAMIFTGATTSVKAPARAPAFAAAKFGLRGFAMALARDLRTEGVHVAHVIVDGVIDSKRARDQAEWDIEELVDPDGIAEAYWQLASQPRRAWSFELDLRTSQDDYLDN